MVMRGMMTMVFYEVDDEDDDKDDSDNDHDDSDDEDQPRDISASSAISCCWFARARCC